MVRSNAALGLLALSLAWPVTGQYKTVNPQVSKIASEVSEEKITAILKKLEGFGTRNLSSSQDDPVRGVGAARRWIYEQFRGYSNRLEVSYDQYRVKKIEGRNSRVPNDVDLYNIVAVLPGKTHPEQRVIISAHYDTINGATPTGRTDEPFVPRDPNADAPGVTDDGSGTACVMELARVMSQYEFDKTVVFITFSGEEEGLLGSTLYAAKAKANDQRIEAVLNNDIIGSDVSGSGRTENRRVSVFSTDPIDSPARTLARYVREIGDRYVPSMRVDPVFREDRVGRGGDHTPFALEGFAAVRLSSPEEDYSHQHTAMDLFQFTSPPYVTRVTRVNAAVAASLAFAPAPPIVTEQTVRDGQKTTSLLLTRGDSRYDARLRWKPSEPAVADLLGYAIVMRATTAPFWEREVFVGNVTEYVMEDVSIDESVFGVKAIDKDGNESLVSPYVATPRQRRAVQLVETGDPEENQ
jgi:hypothetical protein